MTSNPRPPGLVRLVHLLRLAAFGCAWAIFLTTPARAQITTDTMTVSLPVAIDYWQYENASNSLTRTLAPVWSLPPGFDGSSRHHAMTVLVFDLASLPPGTIAISAAKIRLYDIQQAVWLPTGASTTDGIPSRLQMFAAGFGPNYDEATWDGTQPLEAGEGTHDPYPRDLATNANVDDDLLGAPWCVGAPVGYTPGAMSAPFPLEFDFDLDDSRVAAEFAADLAARKSSWVFGSTYEIDFIGDPGTLPNCVTTEGVALFPGSSPPTLVLDLIVERMNAADDSWVEYE